MRRKINNKILLIALAVISSCLSANAVSLWVGQSYTWDFSGSILGSIYNMSVTPSGGYLSITGSGFYRTITPTQYFNGSATVTAEWDYTLYYGDTKRHQKVTLTITCNENPVSISPTSVTLSPGETYQLLYSHKYNNEYVGAANAYFSGGNSSFSVSSSGLITAKSPGTGYVNVYSKLSSAANSPSCYVTVKDVEPTGASINNISILADQSTDLSVNISPSNASVKSKQWYVKSGNDAVSISGQRLTGIKPGTATIYCMVNGSVRSNDATVTVTEPKLTDTSSIPVNGATDISVFTNPSVTYSHSITKGDGFNSVAFTANGTKVEGSVEISGNLIRFLPAKPLTAQTAYILSIPSNAIKNKWGSAAQKDVTLSFKTGNLEKATVSMNPVTGSYLTKGDAVTITSYPSNATIYYTTDGSNPTTSSRVYISPIKEDNNFTLKAFAVCEGYENSEIVTAEYLKSESEILEYYPNDANPLFNYAFVTPYLKLSGTVEKSNNFRRITLTDSKGNSIAGEVYLTNYMIVFVPDEPLENCTGYTMDVPRDALKTKNGEVFKGFTWTFTTKTMPSAIAMQGDESVYILSENGVLRTRGMDYETVSPTDASFTYKDNQNLTDALTGVLEIDGGYSHSLVRKGSTVNGYGMALCGETGTSANVASIGEILCIRAGFQTSAIIGTDNSLWMCGRNDFYQLCDSSGTTSKDFIKVSENVIDIALGNGYTLFIDKDNVLWAVGRNHRGQLGDGTLQDRKKPVRIMDGVSKVFASASGFFSACITTDNKLWTWGDNAEGQLGSDCGNYSTTPEAVLDNVATASLGRAHVLALCNEYKLYSWGSNDYGQISKSGEKVTKPTVMANNIMSVCAGPNTSLLLANSGKVTGWGRNTHSNFGDFNGNAADFIVDEGLPYSILQGAIVEPTSLEVLPESDFAFIVKPAPYTADYDTIEWSSNHPEVACIDSRGVIHTANKGKAIITVKLTDRCGKSVTAEATVVCTNSPDNSGITNVSSDTDSWYAFGSGTTVTVENTAAGQLYYLYNLQGVIIDSITADSDRITFDVKQPGVYIVQSGNKVEKVVCR